MIKTLIKKLLVFLIILIVVIGFSVVSINSHIINLEKEYIITALTPNKDDFMSKEEKEMKEFDPQCAIVLGAGLLNKDTPSEILKDRLDTAVLLYQKGIVPKILLSGDHGTKYHNEIHVMLLYMRNAGIPNEDIFCDHSGFNTFDSMERAKKVFKVNRAIVVTQTYHLYRAIYIGQKLDMKTRGVASDQKSYSGQPFREIREVLARNKDFFLLRSKDKSKKTEVVYPINGDGSVTHGE